MSKVQVTPNVAASVNFTPYSAIGTNLTDVRKRRQEHDPTALNLQLCWYLSPAQADELDPDLLARLSADTQPIYGSLITVDINTPTTDIEQLTAAIQSQLPTTWKLPADL